jgi:hypothetical protein
MAPVILQQTSSCASYSTLAIHYGTHPTVGRHTHYYDVRIKKLVRLNVPYSTEILAIRENPVPVPGLQTPRLGVQNTATPVMINTALQLVRQVQL